MSQMRRGKMVPEMMARSAWMAVDIRIYVYYVSATVPHDLDGKDS